MAKYDLLFQHLYRAENTAVEMTFDEIEALVGPLPASASKSRAWWANSVGGGPKSQATAWLNAGREVDKVDVHRRTVRFSAPTWRRGS